MTDLTVSKTILAQLGGNRFIAMTGANNFVGSENAISFKIGRNDKKVTHVRVTLEPSDTYRLAFFNIRGTAVKTIASRSDVYADDLRRVFTRETGLDTSL